MRGSRALRMLLVASAACLALPGVAQASWCGNDVQERDRLPDAVSGRQIHVTYAFPSDGGDRFAELASAIVADLDAIDRWWRREDPTRAPRFDLFAFPGCEPGLGQLDLSSVRLPRTAAEYAAGDTLAAIAGELGGLVPRYAKALVFYDGLGPPRVCGQSYVQPHDGGRAAVAVVYLRACRPDLGTAGSTAWTTAHELVHNLGGLPRSGPPNACPGEPGHVCDSPLDLMGPFNRGDPLDRAVLDVGRDDYYGHGGSWWDVRSSRWLRRLDVPPVGLDVALAGARRGRVVADAPGIACPPRCVSEWDGGSELRLSAEPGSGARFVRWEGAGCPRDDTPFCDLRLEAPTSVRAVFGPAAFALRLSVSGGGRITRSTGGACLRRCTTTIAFGTPVRLRATPARGWRFVRWAGACTGTRPCVVRMTQARAVTAVFARV